MTRGGSERGGRAEFSTPLPPASRLDPAPERSGWGPSAWAKLVLTVLLLAAAFLQVSTGDLARLLLRARANEPSLLAGAVTLGFLVAAANALKWRLLLDAADVSAPMRRVLALYLVGYFLNNILTGMGEVKRIYDLGRESGRPGPVFVSVFLERWTGVAAQAAVALLTLCAAATRFPRLWGLALGCAGVLAAILLLYWLAGHVTAAARFLGRHPRLQAAVLSARESLTQVRRQGRVLGLALGMSVGVSLAAVVIHVLLAQALGLQLQLAVFVLLVPIATVFGQLPVSINGFGAQEVAYIALFRLAGLSGAEAMAVSLLAHGIKMAVGAMGAGVALWTGARTRAAEA